MRVRYKDIRRVSLKVRGVPKQKKKKWEANTYRKIIAAEKFENHSDRENFRSILAKECRFCCIITSFFRQNTFSL